MENNLLPFGANLPVNNHPIINPLCSVELPTWFGGLKVPSHLQGPVHLYPTVGHHPFGKEKEGGGGNVDCSFSQFSVEKVILPPLGKETQSGHCATFLPPLPPMLYHVNTYPISKELTPASCFQKMGQGKTGQRLHCKLW